MPPPGQFPPGQFPPDHFQDNLATSRHLSNSSTSWDDVNGSLVGLRNVGVSWDDVIWAVRLLKLPTLTLLMCF